MKLISNIFVLFLILGLCALLTTPIFCQAKYNVYMIDPANVPIIGGEIDALWQKVTMAPCTTVVKDYTRTHGIDPKPSPADYKINFGMLWSDKGLYFLVRIVDDTLVLDEPGTKEWNGTQSPFPRWWRDDSFNLLFTSDMQPPTTQEIWEFAWLTMNPVEVKALFEKQCKNFKYEFNQQNQVFKFV